MKVFYEKKICLLFIIHGDYFKLKLITNKQYLMLQNSETVIIFTSLKTILMSIEYFQILLWIDTLGVVQTPGLRRNRT
jgi:hypothetical protein